jgi:hypothetical protein
MTVTPYLLVAMLVLSSGAQLGAAVACVGPDGHVDFEPSLCTCCIVPASHDYEGHSGLTSSSPICSDCVDVPLRVPLFKSKKTQLSIPDNGLENSTQGLLMSGGCRNDQLFLTDRMDHHWQSLAPLTTVVLLT